MIPRILIAVPVKDAARHLDTHFALLERLRYPRAQITLAYLEGDSQDGTFELLAARVARLGRPGRAGGRRARVRGRARHRLRPARLALPAVCRWVHRCHMFSRACMTSCNRHSYWFIGDSG